MNKPPAFQFYADDFISGTAILTTEETGAYILMLCHQWNTGGVPNDDKLIKRIAKITQAFDLGLVKSKFEVIDGMLKNRRMEAERMKQFNFRAKQAENGAKGGRPNNPSLTQPKPKPNPNLTPPSPFPSPFVKEVAGACAPNAVSGKKKVAKLADREWIESLTKADAYKGINVRREFGKAQVWMTNHPRRVLTRSFFVNWLNRIDPPIKAGSVNGEVYHQRAGTYNP